MLATVSAAVALTLVAVWVERRTRLWYRLFWPGAQDIGLALEFDSPDYGQFTLINVADETAHAIIVDIREDFSYADEGCTRQTVWVGNIRPDEKHVLSYRYHSPKEHYEIGRLDLWIRCDRGKAYECLRWSYASW